MATDVTMPRLSDSMEEGTILNWIVEEGAEVKRGEPLVEIETDKANMTYDADTDGVLIEIVVGEGETVPLGEVIARIGSADERAARGSRPETRDETGEEETRPEPEREPAPAPRREPVPAAADAGNGRVKASPVARRMAREMGVDIGAVAGTGPGGRIVKADVVAAAEGGATRTVVREAPPRVEAPPPEDGRPAEEPAS